MEKVCDKQNRISFLDELRGFTVVVMIIYHTAFTLGEFFGSVAGGTLYAFLLPTEPFFAAIFTALCGFCCTLSKNNLKRGLILFAVAMGFTLVTAVIMPALGFERCEVYFGILHLLSICILLFALLQKKLQKLSPAAAFCLCVILYQLTANVQRGFVSFGLIVNFSLSAFLYQTNLLMPLGFHKGDFFSADYFPLLPDVFIFFIGAFLGFAMKAKGTPPCLVKKRCGFLAFLGRHSLIIYILHMPVIWGVAYFLFKIGVSL